MDISLILKIGGVGIIVGAICQLLKSTGRDEQATYVSIAGIIVALVALVGEIGALIEEIKDAFFL